MLRSDLAMAVISDELELQGYEVDVCIAYRTVGVDMTPEIADEVRTGAIDTVLLTSLSVGRELRRLTGCLLMGPTAHQQMATVLQSIAEHGLDHEVLDAEALAKRFGQFRIEDGDAAVLDGAKAMAMTVIDLWCRPATMAAATAELAGIELAARAAGSGTADAG